MFRIVLNLAVFALICLGTGELTSAETLHVKVIYAEQVPERPPVLSGVRPVPLDVGLQGARLGVADTNNGGRFVGQSFELLDVIATPSESLQDKIKPVLAGGATFVVANTDAQTMLKLADMPEMRDKIIFNIGARDDMLREEDCRANVLHTLASRAMLTDALAQFLVVKKWASVMLLSGSRENDKAYATAFRHSAEKFGVTIAADKPWDLETDMRESASTEIPLLTQDADTDAIVVADENDDFGPLIPYNTFYARPVMGTVGLMATGWSDVIETWGARQLQNRFEVMAGRPMRDVDFAGYVAVRAIGEAVLRLNTGNVAKIRGYLLSDELQLSAFKGRGLTFRNWNGQLRQPVHLVTHDAQIEVAPFDAFLHEVNELDTLGYDRPETKCKSFQE